MRVLFYAKAPDATKYYRVDVPAKYLREAGVEVEVKYAEAQPKIPGTKGFNVKDVENADVVVFQRPVTGGVVQAINYIKKNHPKVPVVCDYDDDYYNVPRWNPGYPHIKVNEDKWKSIIEKGIDGAICSTDPLSAVIRKNAKPEALVRTIGNGFDFEEFDLIKPHHSIQMVAPDPTQTSDQIVGMYDLDTDQFNEMAEDRTVCLWAGSKFHYCDLDWLPSSISKICRERDDIIFLFVGYMQGNIVKASKPNRLFLAKGVPGVMPFYSLLSSISADIMLAPLDPNPFNASKSNLKVMEAMALGLYPLCSEWEPYEQDLDPELNEDMDDVHGGLVGYEPNAWHKSILETVDKLKDPVYKKKSKQENDAYLRCTHAAELRTDDYINYFKEIIDLKGQK